jgi:hypothetical protein
VRFPEMTLVFTLFLIGYNQKAERLEEQSLTIYEHLGDE